MPLHLDHIAIHARDIAASVRFYGELLGLPEAVNPMGSGPFRWFALGARRQPPSRPRQHRPAPRPPDHDAHRAPHRGFRRHGAAAEAAGVTFGELPNRPGQITTRPDGVRQCFIQDPDNYWVEINDARPR